MEKKTRKLTEAQIAAFDGLSKLPPKTQSLFTRKEALQRKLPQLQHAIAMGYRRVPQSVGQSCSHSDF